LIVLNSPKSLVNCADVVWTTKAKVLTLLSS
jgi:hypothetical protein